MPENPISRREIDEKFISLASMAVGDARAGALHGLIRGAFSSQSIADVSRAIGESIPAA